MRDLARAIDADFAVVAASADHLEVFADVAVPVLLVHGTRTRPYLRAAVDALARTIPTGRPASLPGADHGVTQNRNCWGPLLDDLVTDHEVCRIDAPGHGRSSTFHGPLVTMCSGREASRRHESGNRARKSSSARRSSGESGWYAHR